MAKREHAESVRICRMEISRTDGDWKEITTRWHEQRMLLQQMADLKYRIQTREEELAELRAENAELRKENLMLKGRISEMQAETEVKRLAVT